MISQSRNYIPEPSVLTPRWLHWWAWLTLVLTFGLLTLGAQVTSMKAGLVDLDGKSHLKEPLIFLRQMQDGTLAKPGVGNIIEHGHRFAGIVVGLCTIVLAGGLCLFARSRWLKWLGPAALAAVIIQGLLGVFRIDYHAPFGRQYALIHGCSAQLVFGLLVCIAVFTSRTWTRKTDEDGFQKPTLLSRLSLVGLLLVYGQLVLGGLVRHDVWRFAGRIHQLTAFLVVALLVWLIREMFAYRSSSAQNIIIASILGLLLFAQVGLGIESWIYKYQTGGAIANSIFAGANIVRTLHYVCGSLVFACVLVQALLMHRPGIPRGESMVYSPSIARRLEGVT